LIEQLGQVVKDMVERDPFFNTTISKVIEFPASFSVSSKIDVSIGYFAFEDSLIYRNLVS
jgi:hypothetical protein